MGASLNYIGYCENHNWEGMRRDNSQEAERDLEGHKGWFPNESHSNSGVKEESNNIDEKIEFIVSIINENENTIQVSICTGEEFVIPRSAISDLKLLGQSKSGENIQNMAAIIFNDTNLEGKLIIDLSKLLLKKYNVQINKSNKISDGINATHSVRVQGTACNIDFSYYSTNFNISGFSLQSAEGCSVFEVIKTGNQQLRIKHQSIGGTQCGLGYGAKVHIDIW